MPTRETVVIRPFRAGDEEPSIACYNQVFPTDDGRIPPRTRRHWDWKFAANPTGRLQIVVADATAGGGPDAVVGQYAGIPVWVWAEGQVRLASQTADLVVLPRWRRYGGRPGLFAQLGRLWHELYMGEEQGQNLFTFGWPVPAWRAGHRYLSYLNIRDWDVLFRELAVNAPRAVPAGLTVAEVDRFDADVDGLWARLRPELRLALVRDRTYLNWRYADHPDVTYRLLACRDGAGALRGVAVYTLSDWLRPRSGWLVDWLVPAADADATVALLAACEQRARADGSGVLATIFNQVDPRFLAFQRLGYLVMGTSYFIVVVTTRHDTVWYRDNWYTTPGDSDLV